MPASKKDEKMADGVVVLGTIASVGLVAVTTIALVYNRPLWVRGNSSEVQVRAGSATESQSTETKQKADTPMTVDTPGP